jgi:hypothetical protein
MFSLQAFCCDKDVSTIRPDRPATMIRLARTADVAAVAAIVKEAYSVYLARNGKMPDRCAMTMRR